MVTEELNCCSKLFNIWKWFWIVSTSGTSRIILKISATVIIMDFSSSVSCLHRIKTSHIRLVRKLRFLCINPWNKKVIHKINYISATRHPILIRNEQTSAVCTPSTVQPHCHIQFPNNYKYKPSSILFL